MELYMFREKVDKKILGYIIRHFDELWGQLSMKIYDGRHNITDSQGVKTFLLKYYHSLNENGEVEITYTQKNGFGRKFSNMTCLTYLSKNIRHTIGHKYHIDIDMVNAHPVLLYNHLLSVGYTKLDKLREYVENRDDIIKVYVEKNFTRDDVKTSFLSIINGGMSKGGIQGGFIDEFSKEMENIYEFIYKKYPKLKEQAEKKCHKKRIEWEKSNTIPFHLNMGGTTINLLMCDLENQALDVMIEYFKDMGVRVTSLAYDGLTIERTLLNERNLETFLRECEERVKTKFPKHFKLNVKKMDKIIDIPTDIEEEGVEIEEDVEMTTPTPLLSRQTICSCRLGHDDLIKIIKCIRGKNDKTDYTNIYPFLKGCIENTSCKEELLNRLMIGDELNTEYSDFVRSSFKKETSRISWDDLLKMRIIKDSNLLFKLKKVVQSIRLEEDERKPKTEQQVGQPFSKEYHYAEFNRVLINSKFNSKDEAIDFFNRNVDKYIKFIENPKMYIVNKRGEQQIMGRHNLTLVTTYNEGSMEEPNWKSLHFLRSNGGGMVEEPCISSVIPYYHQTTFYPKLNECNKEYAYNIFQGFQAEMVEEVDMELIQPILTHILECWANGDTDLYDYIMEWFKQSWTTPWVKIGVVLLIYGLEGTGKSSILDDFIIPFIYGHQLAGTLQGIDQLTSEFNAIAENKLFLMCNELSSKEHIVGSTNKLKKFITDVTMTIQKKYVDTYITDNYINFVFCTNYRVPLSLSEKDRRYCCLETSNKFIGNEDYFKSLRLCFNQESANHFFTYIIREYNKDKPPRYLRAIPMTELKQEMIDVCKSSVVKFVEDVRSSYTKEQWAKFIYESQQQRRNHSHHVKGFEGATTWQLKLAGCMDIDGWVSSTNIFDVYGLYCMINKEKTNKTAKKFASELKVIGLDFKRTRTGSQYNIL